MYLLNTGTIFFLKKNMSDSDVVSKKKTTLPGRGGPQTRI